MPMILSGTVFTYVDPMARLFYDDEEKSYIEVKMIDFNEEEQSNNFEDLNYYKTLPGVFRFDADGKYHGTLFRFPFRDAAPENPNSLSDNCFNSEKINGLISAFRKEAATMLVFLKNVNQITFEVLDGAEIEDTYSVKVSQSSLQMYSQSRKEFLTNIKEEMEKETFLPHSVTYEIKLKELSGDKLKELHFCLSEFFGSNYDREFMDMVKDKELSYVPLVGVAYQRDDPHSGGHIYCGLPLPFSQESLTGLPIHVNGYFALGPDRKDLKWKSISTAKSGDKSVLWNEILIKKLLPQAYLNLLKFLIFLDLKSSDVYGAWPSKDKVNSKWKIFLPKFHSQLVKESCMFSDGMEMWEIPSKIQLLKRRYFKQESEFEVIYKYLKTIRYKFAVIPEELLAGVQGSVVMDRAAIQNLVAQNISVYQSFNKEEQNFLLSYLIRDQADAAKFIGKIPLKMASGLFTNLNSSSSTKIYLPVEPYSKEFLLSYEKVIDVEYYSHKNTQILQALGKTGMRGSVFVKKFIEGCQ